LTSARLFATLKPLTERKKLMRNQYTVTVQEDRLHCSIHGDLGKIDEAMKQHTVMYSAETGYLCMSCIGEDVAASELPEWAQAPSDAPGRLD
jgi:hypothetical protein